jgi:hypothetical protein
MNQLIAESRELKLKNKTQNMDKSLNNLTTLPWEYFAGLFWALEDEL